VFGPIGKTFDYAKKRVTDLDENSKVWLPKATDEKVESELGMIRGIIMEEFDKYKREVKESLDKEDERERKERGLEKTPEKDKKEDSKFDRNLLLNQEWSNLTK